MVETVPFLWDKLIGQLFFDIMGGNLFLVGLVVLFFFAVFGIALRLTLEIQLLMLFFLSMLVLGSLIGWWIYAIFLLISIAVGIYLFSTMWGR